MLTLQEVCLTWVCAFKIKTLFFRLFNNIMFSKLLQALILITNEFSLCFVSQLLEPVLLLGKERFAGVDIRVRVKGGGHVAQIYGMVLGVGWNG